MKSAIAIVFYLQEGKTLHVWKCCKNIRFTLPLQLTPCFAFKTDRLDEKTQHFLYIRKWGAQFSRFSLDAIEITLYGLLGWWRFFPLWRRRRRPYMPNDTIWLFRCRIFWWVLFCGSIKPVIYCSEPWNTVYIFKFPSSFCILILTRTVNSDTFSPINANLGNRLPCGCFSK